MNPLPSVCNEAAFAHRSSVVCVGQGNGTGFVIGSTLGRSLVMTCEHVVSHALRTTGEVTVNVPSVGSVPGVVVLSDEAADVAIIMIDSTIADEAVDFSNDDPAVGRAMVMLGYFSKGGDIISEPGTSHGYSVEPVIDAQHHCASYTSIGGTSGAPVFVVEDGRALVVGMNFKQEKEFEDGKLVKIRRRAITVPTIVSCMRNKLGPKAEGMVIPQMVSMIIQRAVKAGG